MPNYKQPFQAVGEAGGGALGALASLLDPLDMPRRALWNVGSKLAEGDFLGAAPGLLGIGAGGLAAATGVGLPLSVLIGSLIGGAGQGLAESVDEERFAAPTADQVTAGLGLDPESLPGMATSFGLGIVGDPLTFAGTSAGGRAGAAAGGVLERAAATRGPRYAGGAEKLAGWADHPSYNRLEPRLSELMASPQAADILSEIPPGSTPLGAGAEAIAMRTPEGGVVRIGGGPKALNVRNEWQYGGLPPPRADVPEVLQPARDVPYGDYRVEHLPMLEALPPRAQRWGGRTPDEVRHMAMLEEDFARGQTALRENFQSQGYNVVPPQSPIDEIVSAPRVEDLHLANIGRTPENRYLVLDPGTVTPATPTPERLNPYRGGRATNALLDLLGSDQGVRRDITRGLKMRPGLGIEPAPFANSGVVGDDAINLLAPTRRGGR
jgi:hypothetical protein